MVHPSEPGNRRNGGGHRSPIHAVQIRPAVRSGKRDEAVADHVMLI